MLHEIPIEPITATVDLGSAYNGLTEIRQTFIHISLQDKISSWLIEASIDGIEWCQLGSYVDSLPAPNSTLMFSLIWRGESTSARFIKFIFSAPNTGYLVTNEVRIFRELSDIQAESWQNLKKRKD